jgi:hypothetical protein
VPIIDQMRRRVSKVFIRGNDAVADGIATELKNWNADNFAAENQAATRQKVSFFSFLIKLQPRVSYGLQSQNGEDGGRV